MTINTNIKELQEQIKQGRVIKDSDSLLEFKQGLLNALKIIAKDKQLDILELPNDVYLDVVKKRFNVARGCAITVVSKSDRKDIGEAIVPDIIVKNSLLEEVKVTYNQLTLDQILSLNPTNTNLESLVREMEYLESLLPKQLSEDDIIDIISKNKLSNIKDIMSYFRLTYPNQYDNKLLSNVAKNIKLV